MGGPRSTLQVAALVLGACGASSRPPAPDDAGSADARPDLEHALPASDAATDAEGRPEEQLVEWEPLPDLPDFCGVERAPHPEQVFRFEWEACSRENPGCEMMVEPPGVPVKGVAKTGFHDGERGYFAVRLGDPALTVAFVRSDGRTVGAFRHGPFTVYGPRCTIEPVTVDRGGSGFGLVTFEDDPMEREHRIYRGPRDDLGGIEEPIAVLGPATFSRQSSFSHLSFSEEATAFLCDAEFVARIDEEGTWFFPPIEPQGGPLGHVSIVGRDLFWKDYTPPYRLAHGSPAGDTELFRSAPRSEDLWGFRTDGEVMTWTEEHGGLPQPNKLWTAPYTTDPSALAAREVGAVDHRTDGVIGGGLWAYSEQNVLVVYDLDDGTVRRYAPGFWSDLTNPLYVTRDEIVVVARVRPDDSRVFRLHLGDLGWEPRG